MKRDRSLAHFLGQVPGWSWGLVLFCVSLAVYLPALKADFVWDARAQILTDDFIHNLRNLPSVLSLRVLALDVLDNNRPINLLTLMLDSALWKRDPLGYHLTSVLWHAATVVLLFSLCRRFAPDRWAFVAALIFAVHPLNCEAVAEVSYREDLLAAFFVLAGLNLAAVFKPERSWKALSIGFASAFCFFLAVCAKENAVAGPVALLSYWWLFRRDENRRGWALLIAGSSLAVAAFLAARFSLQPKTSAIFHVPAQRLGGSFVDTLLIQPRIWAFYFRQIIWPHDFSADYGIYSIRNFGVGVSLVVLLAVLSAQIFGAWRNRVCALGVAIFWFSLLPVSNFIPIYRPMADRFLYLPMTGLALMLSALPIRRFFWLGAGLAGAAALSAVTFQREKVWHDSIALWTDTARQTPTSADAWVNLGGALFDAGRLLESVRCYERAITLTKETAAGAFAEMALPLDALGRTAEADAAFKKAVAINGIFADPDLLVKGLTWERHNAEKLRVIAARN